MKGLRAWLTRRQTCACGAFKLSRAAACFDCTQPDAQVIELVPRHAGRHAA